MAGLELKVFPAGPLSANNYLIFDKKSRHAFIVDLSASEGELFDFIEEEKITVKFVALTHAHFDHTEGVANTEFPFYLHRDDQQIFIDPDKSGSLFSPHAVKNDREPSYYQNKLFFQNHEIEVIHTPGHTPGSVTLKLDDWLFTGDTLFYESVGRTDLPLGSGDLLLSSIRKKILSLPPNTIVYPGHGASSTLAHEKINNPFLSS